MGGAWVDAVSGATFDVEDPATGEVIAKAAKGETADIDAAVRATRRVMDGAWSKMTPMERTRLMLKRTGKYSNWRQTHRGKGLFSATDGSG
jgi:acyl-CoA reductase-like NAD-dependent aldehyde dehydrogenase